MPLHNIIIPQGRSPLASSEMFSHHYGNMQMQMIPLREMPLHNIIILWRQKYSSQARKCSPAITAIRQRR